ncbi:hypothetical protein CRE_03401 [Caenorhabditis remanei]|uniref:Uncharacterized protein n=1 Tax=Caenorhabditis remanei TaxID=31234 RepID=E3NAL3_CAERE|nr:hypothetical protein CRE_03401 [Caenorhabditis remanei]
MNGANPLPLCPSDDFAKRLGVSENILNIHRELTSYAERVPLINGDDIEYLDNPTSRGCHLWYLRREQLPHPAIFLREVVKREPYMANNCRLKRWIRSMLRGTYSSQHDPADHLITSACSACGSSCLGAALVDHSEKDCGFVLYLSNEEKLQFSVANTYAFCGFCNSRSVSHTHCDMPRRCRRCHREGHQHYHGVCALERTPLQFQEMVHDLRIQRGRRIKWLLENGSLGFPLPNDYIPLGVHQEIRFVHNRGLTIRGVGALPRPAADEFGKIPDCIYRWKPYYGLLNRELDHRELLVNVTLTRDEHEWFILLERQARRVYREIRDSGRVPYIMKFTYLLEDPVFPPEIYALGLNQNQGARVVELPNNGDPRVPLVHEEREPQAMENIDALVESFRTYIQANPPVVADQRLQNRIVMQSPAGTLREEMIQISNRILASPRGTVFTMDNGVETDNVELYREERWSHLVLQYIRNYINCMSDDRYTFKVCALAVAEFNSADTPTFRPAILWRIQTWQLILTGQFDDERVSEEVTDVTLARYVRFLADLGQGLAGAPSAYVRLAYERVDFNFREVFMAIPTLRLFEDPVMIDIVRRWMEEPLDGFARFNAPRHRFPYSEDLRGLIDIGISEERERARELEVQAVIDFLDVRRQAFNYRHRFPSLEVMDILLVYPFPEQKPQIISRVQTMQLTLTGNSERTDELNRCDAGELERYYEFCKASLHAFRQIATTGASAPVRMSECVVELLHGGKTSFEVALPSMRVYRLESRSWWLVWIDKTLVPQLCRISGNQCRCGGHSAPARPRDCHDEPGR